MSDSTATATATAPALANARARASPTTTPVTATAPRFTYSLVYRGNAIDGWISAFIAHVALTELGHKTRLYSIGAGRAVTDHQVRSWKGTHVRLLDLSMDKESQQKILEGGALTVDCVDHHETAVADWPEGTVNTEVCTAVQVWQRWYGEQLPPFWLGAVNRISLWKQPLWEDRCLREVLTPVAHMPPPSALRATDSLMAWMGSPQCPEFQALMAQGQQRLIVKDQALMAFLTERGRTHVIQESDVAVWGLSPEWVGVCGFLLENSEHVIDTNEAAHLVFTHNPTIQVFINFRKKVRTVSKGDDGDSVDMLGLVYLYSARSTAFDLRTGGFFQGQKQSAGATAPVSEIAPFVVSVA